MNLLTNKVTQLTELSFRTDSNRLTALAECSKNIRLAVAIEKLVGRADKISDFEKRLERVEKTLFK